MKIRLFRNDYCIYGGIAKNYLGAGCNNKKPLPGEDWIRGRDLADGSFSLKTIISIIKDIFHYEKYGVKR